MIRRFQTRVFPLYTLVIPSRSEIIYTRFENSLFKNIFSLNHIVEKFRDRNFALSADSCSEIGESKEIISNAVTCEATENIEVKSPMTEYSTPIAPDISDSNLTDKELADNDAKGLQETVDEIIDEMNPPVPKIRAWNLKSSFFNR